MYKIPSQDQFEKQAADTLNYLNMFDKKLMFCSNEVEKYMRIIARYDEVIAEKAQKHDLAEFKKELEFQVTKMEEIGSRCERDMKLT